MASFTEEMETLTGELLTSRQDRAAFVTDMQERSKKIVADAQTFVRVLGQEHKVMAEDLRKELVTNLKERSSTVKAQRQQNREHHQTMSKGLQETLTQTHRERQKCVAELRTEFQTVQKAVASDLQQAAQVWQKMFHTAATTNGGHKGKGKGKVTIGVSAAALVNPPVKATEPAKTPNHSHSHGTESKKPIPETSTVKATTENKKPTPETIPVIPPVKVTEPAKPHAADSKKPNHEGTHGHAGKATEPRHTHN